MVADLLTYEAMFELIQTTRVPVSGGGVDRQILAAIIIAAILLIVLVVVIYRWARKMVEADNEWSYDQQSLIKTERRKPQTEEAKEAAPVTDEPPPPASLSPELPFEPALSRGEPVSEPEPPDERPEAPTAPPPTSAPRSGAGRGTVFRTFEHAAEAEKQSRIHYLVVTAAVLTLLAVYLFVPPVQETINSGVLSVTHRLEQLFERGPATPTPELTPLPPLEIIQTTVQRGNMVTISGEVRNISSETWHDLFAEFALTRRAINLPETRLAPITPTTLPPNLQGEYTFEVSTTDFSEYRLARIVTADKKEIAFRLSMAMPTTTPGRQ
jgi:hypothetical protein